MYDLIIIGAGPAGLAASMYALRKRLDFLVIAQDLGGRTNTSVAIPELEDYTIIKGREQVAVYRSRLHYRSELYRKETVLGLRSLSGPASSKATVFETRTRRADGQEQTYQSRTVLLASGTKSFALDVPGMRQFWGRGLGTNIQSYDHAFWEREVFLYGDSDRVVLSAQDLGSFATKVSVALAPEGTYNLDLLNIAREDKKIRFFEDARLVAFQGNDYCRSVEIQAGEENHIIHADGFFLEFDLEPALDFVDPELGLSRDEDGCIEVDKFMQSNISGIFAAGDASSMGRHQVLTALGQGAGAAMSIYQWLRHPSVRD